MQNLTADCPSRTVASHIGIDADNCMHMQLSFASMVASHPDGVMKMFAWLHLNAVNQDNKTVQLSCIHFAKIWWVS